MLINNSSLSNLLFEKSELYSLADTLAVVADSFVLGDNTGTHEVGHILGGYHAVNTPPTSPFRKGVRNTSGEWQSMMGGYSGGCAYQGQNNPCVRINRFSKNGDFYVYTDANNNQQSDSLGDNSRDMSSWLNNTAMDEAKDWTNSSPSIPTAPTNLTVSPGNCYGSNFMSWNGSDPNTLQYYLEYSDISNFSSPQRIYTGWSNSKNINVTTGTWYLRVRACNIFGCSAYLNQVSASRINTCS